MYGNTLLNIHFKHLNRDTSKVLSCRAQLASLSLDHTGHRSSVIKKKRSHIHNVQFTICTTAQQPPLAAFCRQNKQESLSILQISWNVCNIVYPRASPLKQKVFSLPNPLPSSIKRGDGHSSQIGVVRRVDKKRVRGKLVKHFLPLCFHYCCLLKCPGHFNI